MAFDLLLMTVEVWKNLVLRLGQVNQISLDFCFQRDFSWRKSSFRANLRLDSVEKELREGGSYCTLSIKA
jgi:hypothetical protein